MKPNYDEYVESRCPIENYLADHNLITLEEKARFDEQTSLDKRCSRIIAERALSICSWAEEEGDSFIDALDKVVLLLKRSDSEKYVNVGKILDDPGNSVLKALYWSTEEDTSAFMHNQI